MRPQRVIVSNLSHSEIKRELFVTVGLDSPWLRSEGRGDGLIKGFDEKNSVMDRNETLSCG